jgi:hypothetical protein
MVISDDRKGQMWYRTKEKWLVESLKNVPETNLQSVHHLSVSPDDKMLAIVSVGEGHPYLEVFDLGDILANRDDEEDRMIKPLRKIDPYPGYISVVGWKGDKLIVSSDMPLDRLDKKERRAPGPDPMPEPKRFVWHVATDTITEE